MVYGIAIAAGVLLIVLVVVGFHCHKRAEAAKRKRRLSRFMLKEEEQRKTSDILALTYANQGFEKEYPASHTDSVTDAEDKNKNNNRVFHLNLNNKGKSNANHVIVEMDTDDSSGDSGARSEDNSDIFSNDRVTVTDGNTSSESPQPRRKNGRDETFDDYIRRKQDIAKRRRHSADIDVVTANYNPCLYFTTPNRGHQKQKSPAIQSPIKSPVNQPHRQGAQRKASNNLDSSYDQFYQRKQDRMKYMRSHSLGDLTAMDPGSPGDSRAAHMRSYFDVRFSTDSYNENGYNTFGRRGNRGRGIWAKTNERR